MMPRQPIRILTPDERKGLSKTGLHAVTRPKEPDYLDTPTSREPDYLDTSISRWLRLTSLVNTATNRVGPNTYTITFNDDENTMSMRPYTPSDDAIEH